MTERRAGRWWGPVGLILLVVAAYGQTLSFKLVYEDPQTFEGVPALERLGWWGVFASPTSAFLGYTKGADRMYRPLQAVTAAMDRRVWGTWAGGFHLTSLLAHLAFVLLVYRLAGWMTGRPFGALAAGALLAVHPAAVEAVTFLGARMDLLAGVGMAAALLLVRGCRGPRGGYRLAGALICFAFALCAKETAMAIPAIILWVALVHPRWFADLPSAPTPRQLALVVLPFWALLGLYAGLRRIIIGGVLPTPIQPSHLPEQALRALVATGLYGRMTLFPTPPTAGFPAPPPEGLMDPRVLLGFGGTALALGCLLWLPRRYPAAAVALGWYIGALVPASNVVPIYGEAWIQVAERSLYPALGGWCLLVSLAVHGVEARWRRRSGQTPWRWAAVGGLVLGTLLLVTVVKGQGWRDNIALWTATVTAVPDWPNARAMLAWALAERGDMHGAEAVAQEAAARFPDAAVVAWAQGDLAEMTGEPHQALHYYERAAGLGIQEERVFRQAALVAARQQEWEYAARWFRAGAALSPRAAWPQVGLAYLEERRGQADLARADFERAAQLEPRRATPFWFLGHLRSADGHLEQAAEAYRSAIALDPFFLPARFSLADTLERLGRPTEAAREWRWITAALPQGKNRDAALAHLRRLEAEGVRPPPASRP